MIESNDRTSDMGDSFSPSISSLSLSSDDPFTNSQDSGARNILTDDEVETPRWLQDVGLKLSKWVTKQEVYCTKALRCFQKFENLFTFWQDFDDAMAAENNLPANETPNLSESGSTVPDWLRRVNIGLVNLRCQVVKS